MHIICEHLHDLYTLNSLSGWKGLKKFIPKDSLKSPLIYILFSMVLINKFMIFSWQPLVPSMMELSGRCPMQGHGLKPDFLRGSYRGIVHILRRILWWPNILKMNLGIMNKIWLLSIQRNMASSSPSFILHRSNVLEIKRRGKCLVYFYNFWQFRTGFVCW